MLRFLPSSSSSSSPKWAEEWGNRAAAAVNTIYIYTSVDRKYHKKEYDKIQNTTYKKINTYSTYVCTYDSHGSSYEN